MDRNRRKKTTDDVYKKKKTNVLKAVAPRKLQRKINQDYIDGKNTPFKTNSKNFKIVNKR